MGNTQTSNLKGSTAFQGRVVYSQMCSPVEIPRRLQGPSRTYIQNVNQAILDKFDGGAIGHAQNDKDLRDQIKDTVYSVGAGFVLSYLGWWILKVIIVWLIEYYFDSILNNI